MQRPLLKFVCFFILLLCFSLNTSADDHATLHRADSLFELNRYTESLHLFESLYAKGLSSKAMLLKMAYIHEGLENKSESLFYLNSYFLRSNDKLALQKMEEIANKNSLAGYETMETDILYALYQRNFVQILLILTSLMLLIVAYAFYQKQRKQLNKSLLIISMLLPSMLLALHINIGVKWKKGVVLQDATVLMKGPSAAAGVYNVVSAGTRFDVVNKTDSWLVVKTPKGKAFVKESALRKVEF
jgi:hypothetical protein